MCMSPSHMPGSTVRTSSNGRNLSSAGVSSWIADHNQLSIKMPTDFRTPWAQRQCTVCTNTMPRRENGAQRKMRRDAKAEKKAKAAAKAKMLDEYKSKDGAEEKVCAV